MTVSASIPAAVMTVAIFRLLGRKGTILEANISQTIGSASTALATGSIYTLPALFLWGMAPPYLQVVALCFLGGVLGLAAMIPLRRLLIVQAADELPYPEGTACAEVLRATAADASDSAWIFRGMAVGAAIKIAVSLAFLFPSSIHTPLPSVLPQGAARPGAGAGAVRRRLHPRLPAVGHLRRGVAGLGAGPHAAHRVAGRQPRRPALPRDGPAGVRDVVDRHLGALRALHRRGRGRNGRHPDRGPRAADDGRRVRGGREGHEERLGRRRPT